MTNTIFSEMHMKIDIKNLSGLEILKKRAAGELPNPSMFKTIPMEILIVEKGHAVFEAVAGDLHLNPAGTVHGGFIATVMDSVMSASIRSVLDAGSDLTTMEINVKYLKPVPHGVKLIADAQLINTTKRVGVAEGTLKDEAGNLYAFATTSCMIFR